jgi:Tol biopolymer transport system component
VSRETGSRRPFFGAVLAASCALVLGACGGGGDPRPDLIFVSTRDGDYAIYAMNADGGREKRLTPAHDSEAHDVLFFQVDPAYSPDGARIAFAGRRGTSFDLFVMDADGTGTEQLTSSGENDGQPAWSPDGTRIAYQRGESARLFVMNADGSGQRRITDDTAPEAQPAWSPDGEWIAYVRRTPGTEIREVWLVRPDGSDRRALTTLEATADAPAWSPDGTKLAFASNDEDDRFEIYEIGVDGSGLRRLSTSADAAFEPAWSPDGASIAFSQDGSIAVLTLVGDSLDTLTDPDDNDSSPAWNPVPPPAED